jgi:hypothetical protein
MEKLKQKQKWSPPDHPSFIKSSDYYLNSSIPLLPSFFPTKPKSSNLFDENDDRYDQPDQFSVFENPILNNVISKHPEITPNDNNNDPITPETELDHQEPRPCLQIINFDTIIPNSPQPDINFGIDEQEKQTITTTITSLEKSPQTPMDEQTDSSHSSDHQLTDQPKSMRNISSPLYPSLSVSHSASSSSTTTTALKSSFKEDFSTSASDLSSSEVLRPAFEAFHLTPRSLDKVLKEYVVASNLLETLKKDPSSNQNYVEFMESSLQKLTMEIKLQNSIVATTSTPSHFHSFPSTPNTMSQNESDSSYSSSSKKRSHILVEKTVAIPSSKGVKKTSKKDKVNHIPSSDDTFNIRKPLMESWTVSIRSKIEALCPRFDGIDTQSLNKTRLDPNLNLSVCFCNLLRLTHNSRCFTEKLYKELN